MNTVSHVRSMVVILTLILGSTIAHGKSIEDRKWIRMESQNFTIHSVLGERRTKNLLKHLEAVRTLFSATDRQFDSTVPTVIYALGGSKDFEELGLDPDKYSGLFISRLRQNTVLIRDTPHVEEAKIVIHEYIHYLHHNNLRFPFPKWYQEGFAEYIATSSMKGRRFSVGRADQNRVFWLRGTKWLPMESIIDSSVFWTLEDDEIARFYSQSWLLTHYLYSRPNGQGYVTESLVRFAHALQDGAPEIEAFETGFGVSLAQLTDDLKAYSENDRYQAFEWPAAPLIGDFNPRSTRLSKEEISVELAKLILGLEFDTPNLDQKLLAKARQLYESGLDNNSTRARAEIGIAYLLEMDGDHEAAEEYLISGASLAVDDFYVQLDAAQFWLNRLIDEPDVADELVSKAEPFLRRALAIDRSNAEVVFTTGLYTLAQGDIEQALNLLKIAAHRAPADQRLRWLLAQLFMEFDQPEEALVYANDFLLLSHGSAEQNKAAIGLIDAIKQSAMMQPDRPD